MALTPKIAVENYLAAERELTETFAEVLRLKLDELLILGILSPEEAKQVFLFDLEGTNVDNETYMFSSLPWEETWAYGGYENHFGDSVVITKEFMADPMSFIDAANLKIKADMEAKNAKRQEDRVAKVTRLEKELAEAKRLAELD